MVRTKQQQQQQQEGAWGPESDDPVPSAADHLIDGDKPSRYEGKRSGRTYRRVAAGEAKNRSRAGGSQLLLLQFSASRPPGDHGGEDGLVERNANLQSSRGSGVQLCGSHFASQVPYSLNKHGRWHLANNGEHAGPVLASRGKKAEDQLCRRHGRRRRRRSSTEPAYRSGKQYRHQIRESQRCELELQLMATSATGAAMRQCGSGESHVERLLFAYTTKTSSSSSSGSQPRAFRRCSSRRRAGRWRPQRRDFARAARQFEALRCWDALE